MPGWGLLPRGTVIGDHRAENAYLLLVFDAKGQPQTTTLAVEEIEQFRDRHRVMEGKVRQLIAPLAPQLGRCPPQEDELCLDLRAG